MRVIGASFDTVAKNKKFKDHEKFTFALWSDHGRELALYYGAAKKPSAKVAQRITVILDPDGKWRYFYPTVAIGFDFYGHPGTVLDDMKALLGK